MQPAARADNQGVTNDPTILSTIAFGLVFGAFAFLRVVATERRDRLDMVRSIHEAERAAAAQPKDSSK
jgi:hypothetical protein